MNKLFWIVIVLIISLAAYLMFNSDGELQKRQRKQWQPAPTEEIPHDIQKPAMPEEGGIGGSGHIIDCQDQGPNCEGKLP